MVSEREAVLLQDEPYLPGDYILNNGSRFPPVLPQVGQLGLE